MNRTNSRYAWTVALLTTGALPGCFGFQPCESSSCQDDAATTADVRRLIGEHPALMPDSFDVHTVNHVVYLYGIVDTETERRGAESVARGARGAERVVDLMGVHNGTG